MLLYVIGQDFLDMQYKVRNSLKPLGSLRIKNEICQLERSERRMDDRREFNIKRFLIFELLHTYRKK